MGNRFEVWAFVKNDEFDEFDYVAAWRGESAFRCIWEAIKAKRAGAGCVKVEWRS
jgi:hypothetical protein